MEYSKLEYSKLEYGKLEYGKLEYSCLQLIKTEAGRQIWNAVAVKTWYLSVCWF